MKLTVTELFEKENEALKFLVLNLLPPDLACKIGEQGYMEMSLVIEGEEMDLSKFFKNLFDKTDLLIRKEAIEVANEKFEELICTFETCKEKMAEILKIPNETQ